MDLWKKEPGTEDAIYVKLFETELTGESSASRSCFAQSHQDTTLDAVNFRKAGNEMFKLKKYNDAMILYNQSLQRGERGSTEESISYANRSACFLYLGMYDECLADIELVKKANTYPSALMSKLIDREVECRRLKSLYMRGTKRKRKMDIGLSFPPNPTFPSIANVLKVETNADFGKHIVSTCKLEVGQIILKEKAFLVELNAPSQSYCCYCFKFKTNLIPCPNCSDVMFCGTQCLELNELHKFGCGNSYFHLLEYKRAVETVLLAVMAFTDANELMQFVEKSLKCRDLEPLEELPQNQRNYGLFLKLSALKLKMNVATVSSVFELLMKIPKISQFFNSIPKRRFLTHLILQHIFILKTNGMVFEGDDNIGYDVMSNFMSLFNHACHSNVRLQFCENRVIGYITRPVKKGEQLFVRYKSFICGEPKQEREDYLWNAFQFRCKCSFCEQCCKETDRKEMAKDSDYISFAPILTNPSKRSKEHPALKEKLQRFLNKYGGLPWSPELEVALTLYHTCMVEELFPK